MLNYEKKRGVIIKKRADKAFREEAIRLALSSPQSQENQPNKTELLPEIRTLKGDVSRLKEERDILKKAGKFFANEHPYNLNLGSNTKRIIA